MPRYKAVVEYLGTSYAGWQRQPNKLTIQEVLEKAILKFCGERVTVIGAGRTDAGVHSYGQVAHFDCLKHYSAFEVFSAVNFHLKETSISLLSVEIVDDRFHARFSATERHYVYKIINRSAPLAIKRNTALLVKKPLNIKNMQEAGNFLLGTNDFSSFRSSECTSKSAIKTLTKFEITTINDKLKIYVSADAFLHHMVRNIVGTLIYVGLDKITPADFSKIIQAKFRTAAGPTAPAYGLYLLRVDYNNLLENV
jgi:tRNA pseudouridine38-40 synthase